MKSSENSIVQILQISTAFGGSTYGASRFLLAEARNYLDQTHTSGFG